MFTLLTLDKDFESAWFDTGNMFECIRLDDTEQSQCICDAQCSQKLTL